MILVTGGAGFIGSNFILDWLRERDEKVVNLDKLTYAGNLENLAAVQNDARLNFVQGDIHDRAMVDGLFAQHQPRAVIHFAAESHVDRSIHAPAVFVETNVNGTFTLLEAARAYWSELPQLARDVFRFVHVSTDEVYGSLDTDEPAFTEQHPYRPNSPYSASKAASDHLVRAYYHTYGLPTITTNCSNNYGPFQFPEKLIPLMVLNAMAGKPLPIYGDGQNVRDWLYVTDHCSALRAVLDHGQIGETYNIGGNAERTNLEVVRTVCKILDRLQPDAPVFPHEKLMTFVADRPGHDKRYAMNANKLERELGWKAEESFESGLEKTVRWILENQGWVARVQSGDYRDWMTLQYGSRA